MKLLRCIAWVVGLLAAFLFLALLAGRLSPMQAVLIQLPLGWLHFLERNWPEITWNWNLITTGVFCSAGIVMLGHWLCASLLKHIHTWHAASAHRTWRWRWTLAGYVALWLLFAIAFGAAGVFRHVTWLMNYDRPWYEEKPHYFDADIVSRQLELLAVENDWNLEPTRKALLQQRSIRHGQLSLVEDFEVLFYGDLSNHVTAWVVVPRNYPARMKKSFSVRISDMESPLKPIAELSQTLSNLDATFPGK